MTEGEKGLEGIKPWLENIEVRTVCVWGVWWGGGGVAASSLLMM